MKTVYPLGLTRKARLLSVVPVLISLYMLWVGISAFRSFHPADPSRYLYSFPPITLALAVLGMLIAIPKRICQGQIILRPEGIEWDPGPHALNVVFPWKESVISAPQGPQKSIRTLLIAFHDEKVLIYEFLMPDFDLLVATILKRRGTGLSGMAEEAAVRIDSGKVGHVDRSLTGR